MRDPITRWQRFQYKGFGDCPSMYELEMHTTTGGRTVVICSETNDNPGTSVTNFAEWLATLVCKRFTIAPEKLVWIEHNPSGEPVGSGADWNLVNFTLVQGNNDFHFRRPRWRLMRQADWGGLGLPAPAR
jgi:hypothetical protein